MDKTKADRIMEMAANVALSEIGAGPEITGFSDRDEARASLAALVDEAANAPADPALLALAKFAADVIASHRSRTGKWAQPALLALPGIARDIGVTVRGQLAPGIAAAIAALLAPAPADGAGEVAP